MKPNKRSRHRGSRGGRGGRRSGLPFVDPIFAEELSGRSERDRKSRRDKPDYKTMQLCRQAERALSLALAGECNDDVLRGAYVESVAPAPDATRLLVRVVIARSSAGVVSMEEVLRRLDRVHGILRAAVAQAVTRKRAPELTFMPLWAQEVQP